MVYIVFTSLKMQVASLDHYGATLKKITVEIRLIFFFFTVENSQQIIVMLEAFTLTACTQISI